MVIYVTLHYIYQIFHFNHYINITYWWLLIDIILMAIGDYSIGGYWWLLIDIILMAMADYSIGGY